MVRRALCLGLLVAVTACAGADEGDTTDPDEAMNMGSGNAIIDLLSNGQPVFGMFAPEQSVAGGTTAAANTETDFIFYSLESGPWDIPTMQAFMASMEEASGTSEPHPVTLRIPPIRDGHEVASAHITEGLAARVNGLVLPHVESAEEVALANAAVGDRLWPLNPSGDIINVILIEDQAGIARAREIVGAPGVGVAIPGPGDLRRAYEGDMVAVENAIQTVLAECLDLGVACGITAGVDDIGMRLEQGFRMIIVTNPDALGVGLAASGR